jgi:alkyl hydroperoxide reductase subunit F
MLYDLIIIGGGPGGVAAGIYASRKKLKTALVTDSFGGQSLVSAGIENWIGTKSISGYDLAKALEEHLRAQENVTIIENDLVMSVERSSATKTETDATEQGARFRIGTKNGTTLLTRAVLVTSGSRHRRLGIPGEAALEGNGVMFCATCDAPLFKGKTVAVVGGGNSGLESVVDLIPYADAIYLLHRNAALKGDPQTQEKIRANKKVTVILNAAPEEILGDGTVTGLRYRNTVTGETVTLPLQGVFVEIGAVPNSEVVKDLVKRNDFGEILIDHRTGQTSASGIWAAGDVADVRYKQNNISVGDSIKAVLNIYETLQA